MTLSFPSPAELRCLANLQEWEEGLRFYEAHPDLLDPAEEQEIARSAAAARPRIAGLQEADPGDKFASQTRYKKRQQAAGLCPHCGQPCAPFSECAARRSYKQKLYRNKRRGTYTRGPYRKTKEMG